MARPIQTTRMRTPRLLIRPPILPCPNPPDTSLEPEPLETPKFSKSCNLRTRGTTPKDRRKKKVVLRLNNGLVDTRRPGEAQAPM